MECGSQKRLAPFASGVKSDFVGRYESERIVSLHLILSDNVDIMYKNFML